MHLHAFMHARGNTHLRKYSLSTREKEAGNFTTFRTRHLSFDSDY